MTALPALARLVAALERLPGIGPKSARRIAHFLLVAPQAEAAGLSGAMLEELRKAGAQQAGLISSILDALRVSRRIGKKQLGIPLNALTKAQDKAKG